MPLLIRQQRGNLSIPVEYFPVVDGSMISEDGQTFLFHVRREDGSELMLGFPHAELPNIVENAAMQMDKGKNEEGGRTVSAFMASGFCLGHGPEGETVLGMTMAEGGTINFLLTSELKAELAMKQFGRCETKH